MTTIAHENQKLRELDHGTTRAWKTYREHLRDLRGEEYERAEHECWTELQRELRRLNRQRRALG